MAPAARARFVSLLGALLFAWPAASFAQSAPAAAAASPPPAPSAPPDAWASFNGDLQAQKFSPATQITPQNVHRLRPAWQLHTGDVSSGHGKIPGTVWSATPLFVNNTLYVSTPFYRVFAVDPGTGRVKWIFDPHAVLKALTQPELKTRGVAYWQAANPVAGAACQKIVYVGTMAGKIWAVDADTGKPCQDFGKNGELDVNQWNPRPQKFPLSLLQPPTVYKNTLIIGWAGKDWAFKQAPPGIVFAVDARTGRLKWHFDPLPPDARPESGTADVWASMSVDPKHGIVYLPVSSPSPNFYGGNRTEPIPYATSVTALDAETGKVIWSRQLVHHDIWDYDTNAAPTLVDIKHDGTEIPALVQTTKQGFLFVLNRLTGQPIYPITETKVPRSNVPGEQSAPTQPEESLPAPTTGATWPGVFGLANVVAAGGCARTAAHSLQEGRFTPPSLQGSLIYPPTAGGIEWGGGAVDPATDTYVVNSSNIVYIYKLLTRQAYQKAVKNGTPSGYFAQKGTPYGVELHPFLNWLDMPCWKPPYGTLSSYDLDTGKLLWREPFGQVQQDGFYMPKSWGSITIGGPAITKSGLIFIGASMDARVRALDLKTGKVLWKWRVQAPAVSIPAIYTYKGQEYVVFTAGGNPLLVPHVGDQLIAFKLPG